MSKQRVYVESDANWVEQEKAVPERFQYEPYGQAAVADHDGQDGSGEGHAWQCLHEGLCSDGDMALYHFRHRDYSPSLGRWVQQDPMGYVDGMSLYEYVRSAPVDMGDPLGLATTQPATQAGVDGSINLSSPVKIGQQFGFEYDVTIAFAQKYKGAIITMKNDSRTAFYDAAGTLVAHKHQITLDIARLKQDGAGQLYIEDHAQGQLFNDIGQAQRGSGIRCGKIVETRTSVFRLVNDVSYSRGGKQTKWTQDGRGDADTIVWLRWAYWNRAKQQLVAEPEKVLGSLAEVSAPTPEGAMPVQGMITHKIEFDMTTFRVRYTVSGAAKMGSMKGFSIGPKEVDIDAGR